MLAEHNRCAEPAAWRAVGHGVARMMLSWDEDRLAGDLAMTAQCWSPKVMKDALRTGFYRAVHLTWPRLAWSRDRVTRYSAGVSADREGRLVLFGGSGGAPGGRLLTVTRSGRPDWRLRGTGRGPGAVLNGYIVCNVCVRVCNRCS